MIRSLQSLLVVLTFANGTIFACINEYGTAISGAATFRSHAPVPSVIPIDVNRYRTQIQTLTPKVESTPSHEDLSDLAVAHLYVGELERSIELLLRAESQKPGEYAVASNLGTAYELAGQNQKALEWIEEGIRRNPQSHGGSEWVHSNLLKAKIAIEGDSEWLSAHSVTGLEFGSDELPKFDASLSSSNCPALLSDVRSHLEHQLYERRSFIPNADPIVAALMFDLANATVLSGTAEDAKPIYLAALELGFHDRPLAELRVATLERLEAGNFWSGWSFETLAITAVGTALATAALGIALWLRLRRRAAMNEAMLHSNGGGVLQNS